MTNYTTTKGVHTTVTLAIVDGDAISADDRRKLEAFGIVVITVQRGHGMRIETHQAVIQPKENL